MENEKALKYFTNKNKRINWNLKELGRALQTEETEGQEMVQPKSLRGDVGRDVFGETEGVILSVLF